MRGRDRAGVERPAREAREESPGTGRRPRYGLVGTAHWAHRVHARAAASSDDVEFVAVLGRDPGRTSEFAGRWGVAAHGDLPGFLDQVDLVGLAVPPAAQPVLAIEAARAGKHLILEKPVALSAQLADDVARAAEEAGVRSVVFFTQRFLPEVEQWIAEARRRGGWTYASAEGFSSLLLDPTNPYHASTWRHTQGALWDSAPHPLSLLCPVLGRVREVSAVRGGSDLTVLTLVHESGAISELALSHGMHRTVAGSPVMLRGPHGSTQAPQIVDWDRRAVEAYRTALAAVAGGPGLSTGDGLSTDLRFGAHVTAVLAAAERSIEQRRTVAP